MIREKSKAGRPKKRIEDRVKFQRIPIHIDTYKKLKSYSLSENKRIVDILDDLINENIM